MVKLIVSDIDGTLLQNGNRELSENAVFLIRELIDNGIIFAVASGRQYPNLKRLFAPVGREIVYICENGGFVVYKGEVLEKTIMDRENSLLLLEDIYDRTNCEILLSGENTSYIKPKNPKYEGYLKNVVGNNVTLVKEFKNIEEDFIKISVFEEDGIINSSSYFANKWGDKFKTTVSGKAWMDFVKLDTNKGNSLKKIKEMFEIDKKEIFVFGDNYNDIEMFKEGHYSYAMTNAENEVRAHATYSTYDVESVLYDILREIGIK